MFRQQQKHTKRETTASMGNNSSRNVKAKSLPAPATMMPNKPSRSHRQFPTHRRDLEDASRCEEPFTPKEENRIDVLFHRGRTSQSILPMIHHEHVEAGDGDKVNQKAGNTPPATFKTINVHGGFDAEMLDLPGVGYQLVSVVPKRHFSRYRNVPADMWRFRAHEQADAFVYTIDMHGENEEEYYDSVDPKRYVRSKWEADRWEIFNFLRHSSVSQQPHKPLLLLVQGDNLTKEFNMDRLVNLLGLGWIHRPFRATLYFTNPNTDDGKLMEALAWIARAASDEGTAATERETEEDSSIMTTPSLDIGGDGVAPSPDSYVLDYEPSLQGGNPTLHRFDPVKKNTPCPFARSAKLWGGKSLEDEELSNWKRKHIPYDKRAEHAAALNAGPLAEFVAQVVDVGEPLDGFCLEVPDAGYGSVEKLGEKVGRMLAKLAKLDPSPGENAMKMGPLDRPEWRFRFADEDFFVTTFSPIYPKDSSRQTFGVPKAFLLFQPMTSFGRHGLTQDTPASATSWKMPMTMRDKARVAFKKRGCPYHIPEELPYPVVEHIVKPTKDDGSSCVKWWEAPTAIEEGEEEEDN